MFIKPFHSKRISAELQEVSIQTILDMYEIPEHLPEHQNQRFLEGAIRNTSLPLDQWTLQER